MLIEEKFLIRRPVGVVWDFVMNYKEIAPCVPGCEKVEVVDDKHYVSSIKVKIGPISITFHISTAITEIEPLRRIRMIGTGMDKNKKGNFKQETEVRFNEISENETEVSYRSDVSVSGVIATFGEKIMIGKARELGSKFVESVRSRLETGF